MSVGRWLMQAPSAIVFLAVPGFVAATALSAFPRNTNASSPIVTKICAIDGSKGQGATQLRVAYTNTNNVTADKVAFSATYGGATKEVVDVGSFATNVLIDHAFNISAGWPYGPAIFARCTATAVHFTDGTTWP